MWLHHYLVSRESVITLFLIHITTFLSSSLLCLCYCPTKYWKYENSDFESLLLLYILALYSCLTWSNQTLVCAVLGQRCALPRHTAQPPPRTVNAPFHAVWMKKETQREEKEREKRSADDEKTWSWFWSGDQTPGWPSHVKPVPVRRGTGPPLGPPALCDRDPGGFQGFSSEWSSRTGGRLVRNHTLMTRECFNVAVSLSDLRGEGLFSSWIESPFVCGLMLRFTVKSHWRSSSFLYLLICLLSSFISSGLCESANNTDGIIPPGIIIHIVLLFMIFGCGEQR